MPVLIKGSGKIPKLQPKEVPSYKEKIIYPPDDGYDGFSEVTVNAIPKAAQATPSISISTRGLITASATQSEGYVSAGTKSATNQMTTQKGKDVYPGTTRQLAVAAWRYTIGNIYVNGDSNLTAGNIKKGVSIFGVAGSYEGTSSSGDNKLKVFSGTVDPYSTSRLHIDLSENVSEYSLKMVAVAMTKSDANASLDGLISYSRFPESAVAIAVGGVYGSSYDEFLVYGSSNISEITSNTAFVLSISSTNAYRKFNTDAQYNYLLVYKLNEIEVV